MELSKDEIIRMAREAGIGALTEYGKEALERFAALVAENTGIKQQREIVRLKAIIEEQANGAQNLVLAEREACAKLCDEVEMRFGRDGDDLEQYGANQCAAAIRARGE